MNRLIIVGNGFDLAHGLKTSYCDFISHYLVNILNEFYDKSTYNDPLVSLRNVQEIHLPHYLPQGFQLTPENVFDKLKSMRETSIVRMDFKSELLQRSILRAEELRWVDLENEYYDDLLACRFSGKFDFEKVEYLNSEFSYLKGLLEEYLMSVQFPEGSFNPDPDIQKVFGERFDSRDFQMKTSTSELPKRTLFLNFNYTHTIVPYLSKPFKSGQEALAQGRYNDEIIHIHGELGKTENPIVFGFGDEHDQGYLDFETLRNNSVFHHIKSYAYLRTGNYSNLMRFLDADDFQVFVIGHSCGLSDRTMFREVLEHKHCQSVKVFYYLRPDGTSDFTEKSYDLAKHFSNKGLMRKKIVSEEYSTFLPQYRPEHD